MIFTYHYVSTMSGEPTPFFCINQLFLSASNVAQAPSKRRGNSKGDIIYRYILIILLYIHQLFPWHVKARRHHHGVSMCIAWSHKYRVCQGQLHVSLFDCKLSIQICPITLPQLHPASMSSASSWQCWFCSHAPSLDALERTRPTWTQWTQWHIPMKKSLSGLSHVPFCSILSCPKQRQPVPRAGSRPHPSLCWGAEMVELVMPRNCVITYRHVLTFPWVHTFSYRSCSLTSETLQHCIASRTSSLRNLNHIMVQQVMRHAWLVAGLSCWP